jgi:hypothetical protein
MTIIFIRYTPNVASLYILRGLIVLFSWVNTVRRVLFYILYFNRIMDIAGKFFDISCFKVVTDDCFFICG